MKRPNFDEPLPKAAAKSLRRAAKIARERSAQTGVPLVVWKNGRIAYLSPARSEARKSGPA
jgi:hypothetical protein